MLSKLKVVEGSPKPEGVWGDADNEVGQYLLCSKCGRLPSKESSAQIFVCDEGHVSCLDCGKSVPTCPYKQLVNSVECRKLICKIKMSIPQQTLSDKLASCGKDKQVAPQTEEVQDKGPLVENDAVGGVGKFEFENFIASGSKGILDEESGSRDKIEIKEVISAAEDLSPKHEDVVLPVETVKEDPKIQQTMKKEESKAMKIELNDFVGSKMLKRLMEKKIAEFGHLPDAEKSVAVSTAVKKELAKKKQVKGQF